MASADLEEYRRLQDTVLQVERLQQAGSPQMASHLAKNFLRNAKQQLEILKTRIDKEEQREQAARAAAIAESIQRETALNDEEKAVFGEFLQKECFTKKDFGKLENFYSHSWDKLTDEGKHQMTQRVNETLKRGECTAYELPQVVQDKEATQPDSVLFDPEKRVSKETEKTGSHTISAIGKIDLSAVDLPGVKLTEGTEPSVLAIPGNGATAKGITR